MDEEDNDMARASSTKKKEEKKSKEELNEFQVCKDGLTVEEIAERAYFIWEASDCCHGHDEEHWLRAEKELLTEKASGSGKKAKSKQ